MPLIQIFYWISYSFQEINIAFLSELVLSSAGIAFISAVVIIIFTLNISFISRITKNIFTKICIKIFSLGYAIPGVVLAVGVITPIIYLERSFSRLFNYPPESILTGTSYYLLLLILFVFRLFL